MSLETEIKNLTAAISALVEAMETKAKGEIPNETVEEKPKPKSASTRNNKPKRQETKADESDKKVEESAESEIITDSDVKDLAKKVMKTNKKVTREDIKKMVIKLGATSISELSEESLFELHAQLKPLVIEEE